MDIKSARNNKQKPLLKKIDYSKIKRGSTFTAYVRKNLGSIPSKFDNFLFKLPEESKTNLTTTLQPSILKDNAINFRKDIFKKEHYYCQNLGSGNSIELKGNSMKFEVNNNLKHLNKSKSQYDLPNLNQFKTIYSNEPTLENNNNNNNIENNKNINKNNSLFLKHGTFSKEQRYNNIYYENINLNRYYPGPGDYESLNDSLINQKMPFKYESLFKLQSTFPLIEKEESNPFVGPGSYNTMTKPVIFGGSFAKTEKDKNMKKLIEKSNLGPGSLELPSSINIRDKDKISHFFITVPKKEENLEKKLGIERKEKNAKSFDNFIGPRWSYIQKTKNLNSDWINKNLEYKLNEQKKMGKIVDDFGNIIEKKNNGIKHDQYYWEQNLEDEKFKQFVEINKKNSTFKFSVIPKFFNINHKHVPGPSYYNNDNILKGIKLKKEFNSKIGKGELWI